MVGLERRYLDRFEIPDAEVVYSSENGFQKKGTLADITKISVKFEINQTLYPGDLVTLDIIIPDKDKIRVKGHVVRTIDPSNQKPAFAAVQFLPFGSDERYNSMESYAQLDALTIEFSQKVA